MASSPVRSVSTQKRGCCSCFPDGIRNRNVAVNIAYNIASSAASSLTSGALFSNFIVALPGQGDESVGYVYATAGIVMLILALPLGVLTDRVSRSFMLRSSAVVGLAAAALLFVALLTRSMPLIYAASALSGVFNAASGPALAASFADALPTGERTGLMALQYSTGLVAGALGPGLAAVAFFETGDTWDLATLALVMCAGNAASALSCLLLLLIKDDAALGTAAEGALAAAPTKSWGRKGGSPFGGRHKGGSNGGSLNSGGGEDEGVGLGEGTENGGASFADLDVALLSDELGGSSGSGSGSGSGDKEHVSGSGSGGGGGSGNSGTNGGGTNGSSSHADGSTKHGLGHQTLSTPCGRLSVASIPSILFLADFTIACGAGMSIAFFPLWMAATADKGGLDLSPAVVALVFAASPLLIAVAGMLGLPLARLCGRAGASVLFALLGAGCILVLALPLAPPLAVSIYLVRTAAMNAAYPLQRAILMDVVESKNRGKWASLEGLTAFTWTGSAALGGVLVAHYSFRHSFLITGGIYLVGCLPLALLIPLTLGEKVDGARGSAARVAVARGAAVAGEGEGEGAGLLVRSEGGDSY